MIKSHNRPSDVKLRKLKTGLSLHKFEDCKGCLSEEMIWGKFYYCALSAKINIHNKEYICPCCNCLVKMTCIDPCKDFSLYFKIGCY